MKISRGILLSSAALLATVPASFEATAADLALPVVEESGFDYHGAAEFGWDFFTSRPAAYPGPCSVSAVANPAAVNLNPGPAGVNPTGITCPGGGSTNTNGTRAGYQEYGNLAPGPFLDYATAEVSSKNGLYYGQIWAEHVGNNNQSYLLEVAKAGVAYLDLSWDQTPHLYSTSAISIWGGAPNALTTPFNFGTAPASTFAAQSAIENAILANGAVTTIGIERNTGAVSYRATPTPDWDFRVDYSNMHREGTQLQSAIIEQGFGSPALQMPKPVSDTTQTASASGEYVGTTFWGTKYNIKAGYSASIYQDDYTMWTFQNPFGNGTQANPSIGFMSTPPNNNAQTFTTTAGVDLPWQSRYMGTVSYMMNRQNDPFGPFTVNPLCCTGGPPPAPLAGGLNGQIDTLLLNNVITSDITHDLKSVFKVRYYDYINDTPNMIIPTYVLADVSLKTAPDVPRDPLLISYIKENASEELSYRAFSWLTVGAVGGWERWDRDHMDVNVTNEFSEKFYANAKTWDWGTLRASVEFDERRYESYDALDYVLRLTYLSPTETATSSLMRMFDMANRDRVKANMLWQIDLPGGMSFAPNVGLRFDNYDLDPTIGTFGVQTDNMWNAGADVSYTFTKGVVFLMSYNHEQHFETLTGANASTALNTGVNTTSVVYNGQMDDYVDTWMIGANFELVPDRWDFKTTFTLVHDREVWATGIFSAAAGQPTNYSQYPDVLNDYQRLDATLKYRFDPSWVRQAGFAGDVVAKLRYTWERNSVTNWQDIDVPDVWFLDNSATRMISMAAIDPNFNIQMLVASLALKW
ncbi:MAG TPA: MtrB/PioB family decaheme-associated outer membrane protein [Xanthobacteraceae bacterium]|nr:MtrB/PioB family decaheme-associated outer membrane protein [Xanthobacteraceae bacterium]